MRASRIFRRMEGTQRAAALSYLAFLSLFATIILSVAAASLFFERERATREIIAFIQGYTPIGEEARRHIFRTIAGIVNGRGPAGLVALALLAWSVMRFISTLIKSVNRAWNTEPEPWWRLSLKSLGFLFVVIAAVPLGIALPTLLRWGQDWLFPDTRIADWVYSLGSYLMRFIVLFAALSLFYKWAPRRRPRYSEVWAPAVVATMLLVAAEALFGFYLTNVASLNAVYGAFGAVVALLIWIYLSACIFIVGASLCAAPHQDLTEPA